MLNKEHILGLTDLLIEEVEVSEWGGSIFMRGLTSKERDSFELSILGSKQTGQNLSNVRARLLVLCICDEQGNRVFDDSDAEELGNKSASVLDRLFSKAQELSGLSDSDVEELEKN